MLLTHGPVVQWSRVLALQAWDDGSIPSGTTRLHGLQVFRLHASVVRRKAGFNSRVDLCSIVGGACPKGGETALQAVWDGFDSHRLHCIWAAGQMGRRRPRASEIGVQLPGGPLNEMGLSSNGRTPARHAGNPGSSPGWSTAAGRRACLPTVAYPTRGSLQTRHYDGPKVAMSGDRLVKRSESHADKAACSLPRCHRERSVGGRRGTCRFGGAGADPETPPEL